MLSAIKQFSINLSVKRQIGDFLTSVVIQIKQTRYVSKLASLKSAALVDLSTFGQSQASSVIKAPDLSIKLTELLLL